MKKLFFLCLMAFFVMSAHADVQVKEKLNRAPVAVKTSQGILVSWRYLAADGDATFSVYRNGTEIATGISTKTNYLDADGKAGDTYKVVSSNGGEAECKAWDNMFTKISLPRPAAIKSGNTTGRYRPDDISVGDLDGDGDYEFVVKWMPDNQRDNGDSGYTSPCILEAYEFDGTRLWQINLGLNIRSGNHYTQFLVYDFDGDGKAEMICKTAPGSKDGKGNYVSAVGDATIQAVDNSKTYVNSSGHVTGGEEFLTVFNGQTGAAMNTVWYNPNRSMGVGNSNMTYGAWESELKKSTNYNRGERFNAAVAYLDGYSQLPSAIMQRGYYGSCFLWAVDWDGTNLKTRWLHKGTAKDKWSVVDASGSEFANETTNPVTSQGKSSFGQGIHGISIGDVDGDDKDDIVTGGATIGHDGKLMCATGYGHGDAIHLADLCPDRPGLEVMMPHEEKSSFGNYGYDVHDATTGEILYHAESAGDNGRGLACDFVTTHKGSEFWSSAESVSRSCADGTEVLAKKADTNFRIYWTGDPFDQTFDGRYDNTEGSATKGQSFPRIRSYNSASGNIVTFQEFADYGKPQTCNSTKATPCLQADLFGDWREEIIMTNYETDWSAATCDLLIYSTPEPTNYKVPCLMEDHQYRMAIAWQNASYNQPPHLSYSLAESLGIDRATYKTQTDSHAPEKVVPPAPTTGKEKVGQSSDGSSAVSGTSYTTALNMVTDQGSGNYVKFRTNQNGDTWTFNVNEGYVITSISVEGYSNNSLATISATSVKVDDTEQLTTPFVFGAGSSNVKTLNLTNINAKNDIVFTFDNSNITGEENKKYKQIQAIVTISYALATGVKGIQEENSILNPQTLKKVVVNGKLVIIKDGKEYNAAGQRVE